MNPVGSLSWGCAVFGGWLRQTKPAAEAGMVRLAYFHSLRGNQPKAIKLWNVFFLFSWYRAVLDCPVAETCFISSLQTSCQPSWLCMAAMQRELPGIPLFLSSSQLINYSSLSPISWLHYLPKQFPLTPCLSLTILNKYICFPVLFQDGWWCPLAVGDHEAQKAQDSNPKHT